MKNILILKLLFYVSVNCAFSQKWDKTTVVKSRNNEYFINDLGNSSFISNNKNTLKKEKENSNPNFRKIADDYEYVWTSFDLKNLNKIINSNLKNNIDNLLKEKIRGYKNPIILHLFLDRNGNIKELEFGLKKDSNFIGDDFENIEGIVKKIKVKIASKRNSYYSTMNYVVINAFIFSNEY